MNYKIALVLGFFTCAFALSTAPAFASEPQAIFSGGTFVGRSIVVQPDQVVRGDVTVIGGDADVEGVVDGDVTTYGGSIQVAPGGRITGNTHEYGGPIASVVPWGAATAVAEGAKMTTLLAYSVVVVLIFLIFPVRVRTTLDRMERHPGLSAAIGVLALIASVPIAVLLFLSFVGWPLIPLEIVAYIACVLIGQAALGLLIGRRLYEMVHPHGTPSPLAALILGLVLLAAAELLPGIGWLVVSLVWLIGLGAAILAFVRETPLLGHGGAAAGPPPSGPPMPA